MESVATYAEYPQPSPGVFVCICGDFRHTSTHKHTNTHTHTRRQASSLIPSTIPIWIHMDIYIPHDKSNVYHRVLLKSRASLVPLSRHASWFLTKPFCVQGSGAARFLHCVERGSRAQIWFISEAFLSFSLSTAHIQHSCGDPFH